MSYNYSKYKVIYNREISTNIYIIKIRGSFNPIPGQFFMMRAWKQEPILGRPISVFDVDEEGISFLYQVVGRGTELLKDIKAEEDMELLGPLGNGFPVENIRGRVAIVAGGIGIAPMVYLAKSLKNCDIDMYAGFRNETYALEKVKSHVKELIISTETGIEGYKGYITNLISPDKYDIILCCGPEIMMDIMVKKCKAIGKPILVSTEKRMACGIGACLVCSCKTKSGNKRSCKDGPVFLGEDLI